jgi:hypothetical protein
VLLHKISNTVKLRFPPNKYWKYQRQTDPPTFGWAKFANAATLDQEVKKRRSKCIEIVDSTDSYCNVIKGKVSLIVLSCKRWWTLERLLKSAGPFFSEIEDYPNIEKILVDNASGDELIGKVKTYQFFDEIVEHTKNLGMVGALKDIFEKVDGEYILFFEDDFIVDYQKPFIKKCLDIFSEYPEIGLIRLKNQNNWWKPFRIISPLRKTKNGTEFWTWLPSKNGELNGWCAGSVMFRKASYFSVGPLPDVPHVSRTEQLDHATLYEYHYGKRYNQQWLTAKTKGCCPFVQPNDNEQSPGWK